MNRIAKTIATVAVGLGAFLASCSMGSVAGLGANSPAAALATCQAGSVAPCHVPPAPRGCQWEGVKVRLGGAGGWTPWRVELVCG